MTRLDYTGLRLVGALKMEHLTMLEFHVGVNEHGWAVVEGEAGENAAEQLLGAVAGQEQVILAQDESGAEQPLFAGIIRMASLITYGEYTRFRIELQSGTIQMDQVKRSRSFQDVKETYSQIAQKVASEYPDGAVIPTVGLDNPLGVPVIQYRETDWEFMKRMASWCGGVVVPETHYSYPRLWFGFPERAYTCTFPEDCYTTGISQRYYELGGPVAGYERSDFLYYDVCSSQSCDLGWYTVYKGQEFLIYEKWGKMERGELIFTYRLGKPGLGWGRKRYNDKISGMTILGEVLSTERETVRLKLDIDEGWNPGGPYPYTWRPETGNMMYCMPQVGTRVSLYFPNYDEQMAMAVNCVRTNGGSCTRMSDPSKRSFVTEHGKEMNLYPQEMSLLGGANGIFRLVDNVGLYICTDKKFRLDAKSIWINGKSVRISATMGELVFTRADISKRTFAATYVQSSRYDMRSSKFTRMEGCRSKTYLAYDDAPEKSQNDLGVQIFGNIVIGMAVVGALTIVGVVAAAIAGVALATIGVAAACVMGAAAIGSVVGGVMDAVNGEARSLGEATLDTIAWGASGLAFFTGGVGLMSLKSAASAAPYIGQLTASQMIGVISGTGAAFGAVGGGLEFGQQLIELIFEKGFVNIRSDDFDWSSIDSAMKNGITCGIYAATGAGWPWQMVFNAAFGVSSTRINGGDGGSMLTSGIVGGIFGALGGAGIFADRVFLAEITHAIKFATGVSGLGTDISMLINKIWELIEKSQSEKNESALPSESSRSETSGEIAPSQRGNNW